MGQRGVWGGGVSPAQGHRGLCARSQHPAEGRRWLRVGHGSGAPWHGGQRGPHWGHSHGRLSPPWCRGCQAGRALPSNPARECVTRGDTTVPVSVCTPHHRAWGTARGVRSQTPLELSWGGQTYLGSWGTERHLRRGDRSVTVPGTATGGTEHGPRTPCSPGKLTFVGAICGGQGGHCKRWERASVPTELWVCVGWEKGNGRKSSSPRGGKNVAWHGLSLWFCG